MRTAPGLILLILAAVVPLPAQDEPSPEDVRLLQAAKTVRINVEQKLPPRIQLELPLAQIAGELFTAAGLTVITAPEITPDMSVWISATVEPWGKRYPRSSAAASSNGESESEVFLYSGALVGGRLAFTVRNKGQWSFRGPYVWFLGKLPAADTLLIPTNQVEAAKRPENAPFGKVLAAPTGFITELLLMLEKLYGPEPMLVALGHSEIHMQNAAAAALKKLSGHDFGKDVAKWRDWAAKRQPAQEK